MQALQKWYSFAENGTYTGSEPGFFDVHQKEWAQQLEKNYTTILAEFEAIVASRNKNIIPYFNKTLADTAENWTIFPLFVWQKRYAENCEKCPFTTSFIEKMPGMTSCTFSILQPHTRIKPHSGDSNVMYRCHLTLKCNSRLPQSGFRVKKAERSWETGKLFAFCDAYEHEAWNDSAEERWILIIDILREEFLTQKKTISSEVNATLFWQLKFQRSSFISHLPKWSRKLLMKFTSYFM